MCAPPLLSPAALAQLREDFPDWDIGRTLDGRLVAEHLHEEPDERREMWILKTTVRSATPEGLHIALCIQQAVRGAEVPS